MIVFYLFIYLDTTHNALWAIGEMSVAFAKEKNQQEVPEFLSPYLEEILNRCFYILSTPEADELTGNFIFPSIDI